MTGGGLRGAGRGGTGGRWGAGRGGGVQASAELIRAQDPDGTVAVRSRGVIEVRVRVIRVIRVTPVVRAIRVVRPES